MLTLLSFPGSDGFASHSPFCLKAMCLLEMSGRDWDVEIIQDLSAMPLGRVPVLRVGDDLIPDSHNIQAYLETQGADFDGALTAWQRSQSHAIIRVVEESLRMGLVHDRWLNPQVWPIMSDAFFAAVPAPARAQVAEVAQEQVRQGLMSHGIAQFDESDRLMRMEKDLDTVTAVLTDQSFLFGAHPTAADAAVAPVIDMILRLPAATGLRKLAQARPTLAPYVGRVRSAIYPTDVQIASVAA
ncbi:glutathione S-transferase family protein [Phaeobacter marinintestinus]|uniref:glutathione S-transferase family protein n=1 Tax=Falsiphaeobacter marinintestinus TaxID=1492905 RepID=UPI001647A0A2|nr:glutathione S-transferase family protein [Phaeobacter marinintestinus]